MSWNGATEHRLWKVLGGEVAEELKEVGRVERSGFETSVMVEAGLKFVRVEAEGEGIEKGASGTVGVEGTC
jgi:hypothetical protein